MTDREGLGVADIGSAVVGVARFGSGHTVSLCSTGTNSRILYFFLA